MHVEEYKCKLREIEQKAAQDKQKLAREYAFSNNTVEIGDVVKGRVTSIKVAKIEYSIGGGFTGCDLPRCVYSGVRLTKKGAEFKSGEYGRVSQVEIDSQNKE